MNKSSLFIFFLVITALAIIAFFMMKGTDNDAPAGAPAAVAMTVSETTATKAEWSEIIKTTGEVVAWQEAIIGAEISGQRLVEVMADVGDTVKKGDILARFNTKTLEAEYAELKANWIAAESSHKRALTLKGSGAMSDQAIDDYVNKAAVAKAQMDAQTLRLKYAEVIAPDDGVISVRTATLGAVGNAGDELFRLIRQNRLEWHGELTPTQVAHVTQGQPVSLTLPNDNLAKASIRRIAPSFSQNTRMVTVFADIETDSSARAGMYAAGEILFGKQTALSVPAKSVVIRDGRNYVFRIDDYIDGTTIVSQQEVEVGQIRDNKAQIFSGISNGVRVVLQGAGFLSNGDRVKVVPSKRDLK